MSIARSLELGLSQLVEESNLVLEVKFLERFKEELPLHNKDSKNAEKPVPAFVKKGCVFKTGTVFKNNTGIKAIPEKIQVPDENWRRLFSEHKEKYLKTADRAYTIKEYHSEVPSLDKASILFLSHFQGMFELTAQGAFESSEAQEKIQMLVASTKRY
jgi:hypothetical protein